MSAEIFAAIDEKLSDTTTATTESVLPTTIHHKPLPYWLVNVPRDQWPSSCPAFLKGQSDKNISILATPDEEYQWIGWERVKELVRTNDIGKFQRLPSDLRRYLEYMFHLKQKYGSIMEFVLAERLHWDQTDLKPTGEPFKYDDDLKILYNDWPYGLEKGIVHLVIWTKFELEEDPGTGLLTESMWKKIDDYVDRVFRSRMPADQIVWFKNWKSLKSIHAIEHFHVMLNNPDPEFIEEITNGDVPLVEKMTQGRAL
ncbi:conserved hypothetical protein [Talaromyces stipitatus ATCC 10500]|uniref:N-acetylglucosamine-induced protein 1 n=1 Tax=Talaromyces stipitatus (strain ATCC 10500 / CBS 375.48 / QM 6759 / NRRL 1006) TaxID=441959 RepID=B8M8F5_TALSN|nr:uncharacterized protein TSTA_036890 [Talaromyces stipitatus ATCC 10500]EED20468.1 conserved hypothetical protein [Talaromyces stipitatus ATCC 10500]